MTLLRLIRTMTLVISGITGVICVLAALIGRQFPVSEQAIFYQPRENFWMQAEAMMPPLSPLFQWIFDAKNDQWTTISLVALDRGLRVNRYLPIEVSGIWWSTDGTFLKVAGTRNRRTRIYLLDYTAPTFGQHWVEMIDTGGFYNPSYSSPDMQHIALWSGQGWLFNPPDLEISPIDLASTRNATGSASAVISEFPSESREQWSSGMIAWTPNSQHVIYSKIRLNLVSRDRSKQPEIYYYIKDVREQREIPISDQPITEYNLSPDGTKMLYTVLREPMLPSQSLRDYLSSYAYYVIDLNTLHRQLLDIPDGYEQLSWSPDSQKIVYTSRSYIPALREKPLAIRLLTSPVEYESTRIGGYASQYPQNNGSSGTFTQPDVPDSTFVIDVTTGQKYQLVKDEFGTEYGIQWLPDSNGIVFNVYQEMSSTQVGRALGMVNGNTFSTMSSTTELYIARMSDAPGSSPQLLRQQQAGNQPLTLILSPNAMASQVLMMPAQADHQNTHLYRYNLTEGTTTEIWLPDEQYMYPIWSQDGTSILLVTLPLSQITPTPTPPLAGGSRVSTVTPVLPTAIPYSFNTSNGSILTLTFLPTLPQYRLYLMQARDTQPRFLTETSEPNSAFWSLSGEALIYVTTDPTNTARQVLYFIPDVNAPTLTIRPVMSIDNIANYYARIPTWRPKPTTPSSEQGITSD